MKKYIWLIALLIITLIVCCITFNLQKQAEHKRLELLCQTSVIAALENFEDFIANGNESSYICGVAEFRSFMTAYLFLNENVSTTEYIWCNTIYGKMTIDPQKVQLNIQGLVDALKYLAKDYTHPNGYHLLSVYINELS